MYQEIKKNWDKAKLLIVFAITITLLLLLTVVYKSDQKITKKSELVKDFNEKSDLEKLKKFLLNQIKSPFINLNYEINKGDTIQKILRKYKVQNSEIHRVIKNNGINIYTVRHTDDGDYKKGIHRGENLYENDGFIVHFFSNEKIKKLSEVFNNFEIESFEEGKFPRRLFFVQNKKIN